MNAISAKKLQSIGLHNSYEVAVAAGNRIYILHQKAGVVDGAKWVVQGINFQTNPKAHHIDRGCMTFYGRSRDDEARDKAIAWASNEFLTGETAWEKDPFGGWHPYGTLRRAVAAKQGVNE